MLSLFSAVTSTPQSLGSDLAQRIRGMAELAGFGPLIETATALQEAAFPGLWDLPPGQWVGIGLAGFATASLLVEGMTLRTIGIAAGATGLFYYA